MTPSQTYVYLVLFCVVGNILGNDKWEMSQIQCMAHRDCLESQQCVDMKCAYPCPGACAHNSICQVSNHMPFCACPPGFVGNPFTGCTRQMHVSRWPPYPGAKKRYEVVSDQLNWYGAVIDCKNRGGRLATILSDEENEMAKQKTRELDCPRLLSLLEFRIPTSTRSGDIFFKRALPSLYSYHSCIPRLMREENQETLLPRHEDA
ncbi:hypothetical protein J6590_067430 [Homalodisca vitripennis]|nr:hypothetical protein J6590_067430 [Homalodisca vitripennis]